MHINIHKKLRNFFRYTCLLAAILLSYGQVQAQVNASCQGSYDTYLNFNGIDTLFANELDNGSTGADQFLINGQPYLTYSCSDTGSYSIQFIAIDTNTSQADTCTSTVNVFDLIAPQAICLSNYNITLDSFGAATLQAVDLDPNNNSYDACGIVSYSINGSPSIPFGCADTGSTIVTLTLTDANGNTSTCSSTINIFDSGICSSGPLTFSLDTVIDARCDTSACTGEVHVLVNGGWPPYQFNWSDGVTTTSPDRMGVCAGNYSVTVIDAVGTTVFTNSFDINTLPGCVWPGDTDNNHEVRNFDLLPLALGYSQLGLLRPNATIQWRGEASPNWNVNSQIIDLPDWKHIDANGDAIIDTNDLEAIHKNYTQNYYPVLPTIRSPLGPIPLFVDTMQVFEGQRISIPINLGTLSAPADSVYALAFSIVYDSSLIQPGSVEIKFDSSWLGTDLLTLQKDFPFTGRTEIALGRKDHLPITGIGEIARVELTIRDIVFKAPLSTTMSIDIVDVRMIDELNNLLPVNNLGGALVINELTSTTSIEASEATANIFPNPTSGFLQIVMGQQPLRGFTLYNAAGQLVMQQQINTSYTHELQLEHLPAGLYTLQLQTPNHVLYKRVLVR